MPCLDMYIHVHAYVYTAHMYMYIVYLQATVPNTKYISLNSLPLSLFQSQQILFLTGCIIP